MKVIVVANDIHIPFHCPKALDIFLAILEDLDHLNILSEIILNGDVADFYGVKLHPKMPHDMGINASLKNEIYQVNKFLSLLQRKHEAKITYIEGNHETRLSRYLCAKAPDLFDMFSIPDLFKLEERGIQFVPYERNQRYPLGETDVLVRHSPYSYGENIAMINLKKKMRSVITGCSHRYQEAVLKDGDERLLHSVSNGCMIDLKSPIFNYVPHENWVNGFSLYFIFGTRYFHQFIQIKDGMAVALGNYYISKEGFNLEI